MRGGEEALREMQKRVDLRLYRKGNEKKYFKIRLKSHFFHMRSFKRYADHRQFYMNESFCATESSSG
jgi:hypothetical protein